MAKDEPYPAAITCVLCQKVFDKIYGATQARYCSSIMIDGRLTCHYGSDHDFLEYEWLDQDTRPKEIINPICDSCIDDWIAKGFIKCGGSYDWTNPFNSPDGGLRPDFRNGGTRQKFTKGDQKL